MKMYYMNIYIIIFNNIRILIISLESYLHKNIINISSCCIFLCLMHSSHFNLLVDIFLSLRVDVNIHKCPVI